MTALHWVGDVLRNACAQVPLIAVRSVFVALPLVLMIWILRLPNEQTTPAGRVARWDENLKLWAWLALATQVIIYCMF